MVDGSGNPVIIAKVAGRQRRLVTNKQWRAAIAGREILRDTEVIYEPGIGRQATLAAEDCPELAAIFDELLGPKEVAPPPPPPPPPAPPPSVQDLEEPLDTSETGQDSEPEDVEPAIEPPEDNQPGRELEPELPPVTPPTNIVGCLLSFGGVIVALAFVAFLYFDGIPGGGSSSDSQMEEAAPVEAVAEGTRYFALRNVSVFASAEGSAIGQITRGQEVYGLEIGAGWLQLSRADGGLVDFSAFSTEPPPPINDDFADDYFTVEETPMLMGPGDSDSYEMIAANTRVTVVGSVNGQYAEVVRSDGRLGYIDWFALGGEGGHGRFAWIQVNNRCNTPKNIALSLVIDGQRSNGNGFWTFAPRQMRDVEYGDRAGKIWVNSTDLYYLDLGDDFNTEFNRSVSGVGVDQARVNGEIREMHRIVPLATEDGAYIITFC